MTAHPQPLDGVASLDDHLGVDDEAPDNRNVRDADDQPADADATLLGFLRHRDVLCPRCGYNLRNLTQPVCPECREPLALKVGVQRLSLAPLLIALVPGGFCAVAVGIFIVMSVLLGPPSMSNDLEVWLTMAFIAASAASGIALACANRWFMRLTTSTQTGVAASIWVVHIGVFVYIVSQM